MDDELITFDAKPEGCMELHVATPWTPYTHSFICEIVGATVTLPAVLFGLKYLFIATVGGSDNSKPEGS